MLSHLPSSTISPLSQDRSTSDRIAANEHPSAPLHLQLKLLAAAAATAAADAAAVFANASAVFSQLAAAQAALALVAGARTNHEDTVPVLHPESVDIAAVVTGPTDFVNSGSFVNAASPSIHCNAAPRVVAPQSAQHRLKRPLAALVCITGALVTEADVRRLRGSLSPVYTPPLLTLFPYPHSQAESSLPNDFAGEHCVDAGSGLPDDELFFLLSPSSAVSRLYAAQGVGIHLDVHVLTYRTFARRRTGVGPFSIRQSRLCLCHCLKAVVQHRSVQ